MIKWQPIETAPKDGNYVLVYANVASVAIVHLAWYRNKEEYKIGQYFSDWTLEEWEGWWTYPENAITQVRLEGYKQPTHWMPMPKEPEPK